MIPAAFVHVKSAASAHLAMGVSQLLMQRPIAVLQLLHLPLHRLPCTLYCCQFDLSLTSRLLQLLLGLLAHLCQLLCCRRLQVCKAISTSLALLLPARPQASTHAQQWLLLPMPAHTSYTLLMVMSTLAVHCCLYRASGPPLAGVPLHIDASAILLPVYICLPDQESQTVSLCCGVGIVILSSV